MRLEERLADALSAGVGEVTESPDLFDRVRASVAADAERRRWRRRWALRLSLGVATLAVAALAASWQPEGRLVMDWWVLEVLVTVVLAALVVGLGPFIKRFGRDYAADVFRSTPSTGAAFLGLTDIAYYLIFTAYILLSAVTEPHEDWATTVSSGQLRDTVARVAGLLLILGLLHGANLFVMPVIGRLLTLNRRLDQQMAATAVDEPDGIDDAGEIDGPGRLRRRLEDEGRDPPGPAGDDDPPDDRPR